MSKSKTKAEKLHLSRVAALAATLITVNHPLKYITAALALAYLSALITSMSFLFATPIIALVVTALLFMPAVNHGKRNSVLKASCWRRFCRN